MLLEWTLRSITSLASLDFAYKFLFYLLGSSSKPFFSLWRFSSNIVFKIFCFFLYIFWQLLRVYLFSSIFNLCFGIIVLIASIDKRQFYRVFCIPSNSESYILLCAFICTFIGMTLRSMLLFTIIRISLELNLSRILMLDFHW